MPEIGSLAGAQLQLLRDWPEVRKSDCPYKTLDQVFEMVFNRRESVCGGQSCPSFVWGQIINDGDELSIDLDTGHGNTCMVKSPRYPGIDPTGEKWGFSYHVHRWNTVADEYEHVGIDRLIDLNDYYTSIDQLTMWCLQQGVWLDWRFLLRAEVTYYTDSYTGESDSDVSSELLYASGPEVLAGDIEKMVWSKKERRRSKVRLF